MTDLRVERDGDSGLVVAWELDGTASDVSVGVGPTPVVSDHAHIVTVPAAAGSVRVPEVGPGRQFVSVSGSDGAEVVVAAERRLPFAGITNFRDLGGYPTTDGRSVRWGQVYRADALHKLTATDVDAFERLGIRTVYDLRGDAERSEFPGPFASIHLSIIGRPEDATIEPPPPDMTAADGERLLRDMYVGTLAHSAARLGTLFTGLADRERLPAVFHCHGGKDRTGVTAALFLLALGVDREWVLDDYVATRRYRTIDQQQDSLAKLLASGVAPEAAAGVLGAPRWAMEETLDVIDAAYGGIDAYLTGVAGMAADAVVRLRELHLSPPSS